MPRFREPLVLIQVLSTPPRQLARIRIYTGGHDAPSTQGLLHVQSPRGRPLSGKSAAARHLFKFATYALAALFEEVGVVRPDLPRRPPVVVAARPGLPESGPRQEALPLAEVGDRLGRRLHPPVLHGHEVRVEPVLRVKMNSFSSRFVDVGVKRENTPPKLVFAGPVDSLSLSLSLSRQIQKERLCAGLQRRST